MLQKSGYSLKQKIIFWIEDYLFFPNSFQKIISFLLLPFTFIYLLIILLKRVTTSKTNFGIPIVSIGNIVVGGSGKTPVTIALATAYGDTVNPYGSKTANYVLAAPNGAAGAPTFRALVAADIPTLNQNTTGSAATFTSTTQNSQFNSIGIGTAASGTDGEILATNAITSYYSDDRLKTRKGNIKNALEKVKALNGFHYEANEVAQSLGYEVKPEVGVSAQEVQMILPEIVVPAPINDRYLTVHYEKLIPLLIEAIKEQQVQIEELKSKLGN